MSILQKYVLKEMLGPLGLGLLVFTFVFLIGQIFKLTEKLFNEGVPAYLAGELILSLLPSIISMTLPMSVLVAILLSIGRLAADREILAIRMSGVNLFHVCIPILVLAALLATGMIIANRNFVPLLNLKSHDIMAQIFFKGIAAITPDRVQEIESGPGQPSMMFFFDQRDEKTGTMKGVNIKTVIEPRETLQQRAERRRIRELYIKLSKQKDRVSKQKLADLSRQIKEAEQNKKMQETLIVAEGGQIVSDIPNRMISINLTTGSMHVVSPDRPAHYNIINFGTLSKGIRPEIGDVEDGELKLSAREMNMAQLRKKMKEKGRIDRHAVEYYQRFSIPLACVAFALIAIPLAVYVRPTGKAIAFAISFLLILLYYGLLNYGVSLGRTGSSFAPFAIFFPNILLSAVGSLLLYRMVMR